MVNIYGHFKKFMALFISVLVMIELFSLPIFAGTDLDKSLPSVQRINEDSTFELVNANIQVGDNDHPETADLSETGDAGIIRNRKNIGEALVYAASKTVGDPMVYLTQKWLNQEYGNVSGFGSVPEDGKTGWPTVYGLLRALQHELGITSLANSFGPSTSALYEKNILKRQDGVTDKKFAILQGALWCKGYSPGYHVYENENGVVTFNGVFDETVENAVKQLKKDAGFINPNGDVTLNVMKALMSMDSFKLLPSSYGSDENVRAFQQKLNRKYEAYTGLNPCDGVYGRNTNKALIYALQAEEGLPIGVANGNFGVTTKLCCPEIPYERNASSARRYPGTSAGAYYTEEQISAFTELLQFALYINGFGDGNFDGVFNADTQQALRAFQQKYAIPVTGKADKGTWLSLFISCGDVERTALACDCATILTSAKAQTLYDNGYRYVGRYLTGTYNGGISKALTKEEAEIIFQAGLRFFPIYQTSARSASYFTEEQGTADAKAAVAAASALGIPENTIIYFAVDFDAMDYEITSSVIPYFKKVNEAMSESIYKTGIYGTRNVCSRISKLGYSCSSFVGDMSTGFSGNLGYSIPDDWAFDQFATVSLGSGDGLIEIDKDGFSGRDQGVSRLEYTLALTAGEGGTAEGSGKFENDSFALIAAQPDPGFIFDGWYENGQKLEGVSQYYVLTVDSNRTLEAKFKPNDLGISDIEVSGSFQKGETLDIAVLTQGGIPSNYTWSLYICSGGQLYYSNPQSDKNTFSFTPVSAGTYMIMAYVTDGTGVKASSALQFTVKQN